MTLRLFSISILVALTLPRCATLKQPNGGPKDTIPPILIRSVPVNNQKNFKGKIVTLTFSEAVKLKDPKEIIVTPSPGKDVAIVAKQKAVTITPKNPWSDSTTYSISFREAIQDITESNPAENLHLAFSTGSIIDSLIIAGTISNALKETIPDKITVAIYQADTFNIFKHQPVYFTRTNKKGKFKIENLKPGRYFIYAFDDKNKNLKVESQSEMFGFLSAPISLTHNIDTLQLFLLHIDSRPLTLKSVRHNEKLTRLKFNKYLTSYTANSPGYLKLLSTFGGDQTEINFYHTFEISDSIPTTVHAIDSIGQSVDTVIYVKPSNSKSVKEKFKFTISSATINSETGDLTVQTQFTVPLKQINGDTITIKLDSASSITIQPEDFLIDTVKNTASFHCSIDKAMLLELPTPPELRMAKNTFISVDNDSSKLIKAPIPFLKPEETGTLSIDAKTDKDDFIIQLIAPKDYKILQHISNTKNITFKNLTPTDYKLRVLIDTNKNGVWDPGNYYKKQEPEKIFYYKSSEGKFEFPIRANWEVGPLPFSF